MNKSELLEELSFVEIYLTDNKMILAYKKIKEIQKKVWEEMKE